MNLFRVCFLLSGIHGLPAIGPFFNHNPVNISWSRLIAFGLPVFITGYCITFLGFKSVTAVPGQPVELVELFFTYCSPNVLMMTLPLFLAMQKVKIRSERTRRFAVNISTCTLGIWMSHYLFLGPCYMLVESLPIHTMLKMIVCTILLLSVTWIFVYAVRKSGNIGRWIMG